MSRLRIPVDRADDLVRAFRARAHLVDHADGFVDLQVSDDHKTSRARIPPELDQAITLERLEHLHTYEVVAE